MENCKDTQGIINIFTEILRHPQKCADFDLIKYLNQYEQLQGLTNFTEAAVMLISSGQIYGHKVELLAEQVFNLQRECKFDDKDDTSSKPHKKEVKRKKLITIDNDVFVKDYDEQPFKTVPIEELSDKLFVERDLELEHLNGPYSRLHTIKKGTKLKYPALEAMRAECNVDEMVFGRIPIIEEDGNVDTRSNYRVFMGYIDEDHNITDGPEYHKKNRIALERRKRNKAFNLYMPAAYLKKTYDIDLAENNDYINMEKYQNVIGNLNEQNMKDMFNYKNGAYLNCILSGDQTSDNELNDAFNDSVSNHQNSTAIASDELIDTFNDSVSNHPNSTAIASDLPLETSIDISAIPSETNNTTDSSICHVKPTSLRESLDEGFISHQHSPYSGLSDMDPYERSMFNPIVEVFNFLDGLNIEPDEIPQFTYLLGPEQVTDSLQRMDKIVKPPTRVCTFTNMGPLETAVNCLKLPKSLLMGKSVFRLPDEYNCANKRKIKDADQIRKAPRISDTSSIISEGSDFFGFGEAEDDERPALVSQDSGLDETVNPVDTDMPEQRPIQDKSSAESQFTDSGFGDDGSMSLTQNESTTSQERPSDILIAAECVPADLTVNTEQDVQRTNAQDAEHNAMRERIKAFNALPENKLSKTVKISELGNKILEVVQSQGGSDVSFDCVIRNVDNTHTANYFLSMLHLVNNGHIDIMTENTDIFTASTYSNIKIKLCSSKN